jgi:hypothetical protein
MYADLLLRPPTAAERTGDVAALSAGTLTPSGLVARMRSSADHQANVDPVARLYRAYFLRNPDPGGLDYWSKRRRTGVTLIKISSTFAGSNEFVTKYGSLSNTAFVDLVYQNVLGRAGDPSGRSFWINRLNAKKASRGQVMLNFSDSNEYRTKQTAEVHVGVLYASLLRRRPSTSEFDGGVASLENGGSVAVLAASLLSSGEYAARFEGP